MVMERCAAIWGKKPREEARTFPQVLFQLAKLSLGRKLMDGQRWGQTEFTHQDKPSPAQHPPSLQIWGVVTGQALSEPQQF